MPGLRFLPYLLADGAPSALLRLGCGMGVGAKGGSIRIVARHPKITVLRPPLFFREQCGEGIPQIVEPISKSHFRPHRKFSTFKY